MPCIINASEQEAHHRDSHQRTPHPPRPRDAIAGWQDGVLRVHVTAPPVDGRANDALERLLAKSLGVPKSAVGVLSGAKARDKIVAVAGIDRAEALRRLGF